MFKFQMNKRVLLIEMTMKFSNSRSRRLLHVEELKFSPF